MHVKPGMRLFSAVCATEVIVVSAPVGDVDLRCGGAAMAAAHSDSDGSSTVDPAFAGGTAIGKRYVAAGSDLELLCTKPGAGGLTIGEQILELKDTKPLPSSD